MKNAFVLYLAIFAVTFSFAEISPAGDREDRAEFVRSLIRPGAIGAEIGVDLGSFSYHVLLPKAPVKLFLIDPWIYGLQPEFETDPTPEKQAVFEERYENVCQLFAPFDNVQILRMRSEDAFSMFPDYYFDYVYIDGEHSHAAVTRDLNNYFPKVKAGGFIIGDDYGWTGVAPAVQKFLKAHQKDCLFLEDPSLGGTAGQYAIRKLK